MGLDISIQMDIISLVRNTPPTHERRTNMKKPIYCKTPIRNQQAYELTATDLRNLTKLVKEADSILSYYINMPENKTGELYTDPGKNFDALYEAVEDLKNTLDDIILN